jgi:hypothetical protein
MKKTPPTDLDPPLRLTPEEREFFQAVEAHFIRLRGRPLILSPRELDRAAGWHREGIPLRVVCRGIDRYFEKRFQRPSSRQRAVSLAYCEEFVRQVFKENRNLAVGGGTAASDRPPGENRELEQGLQRLLQGLQRAQVELSGSGLSAVLYRAVSTVQNLLGQYQNSDPADPPLTVQQTESELEPLNRELTSRMLLVAGPAAIAELRSACAAEIREIAVAMDPALYAATLERMTLRRLRQSYSIPEISLFAL